MHESAASQAIKTSCRMVVARRLELEVEGREHIPASGPALIVCHHFHHLYDGCVLIAQSPRPLLPLVALDWVRGRALRRIMEQACALAQWPVILRADALRAAPSAYRMDEVPSYLRRGIGDAVALLRAGQLLAIFPEAYPNIDPSYTPKTNDSELLPFKPGFIRIAARAEHSGQMRVPLVPAGLHYRRGTRWHVQLRFARPLLLSDWPDQAELLKVVEAQVRQLSAPEPRQVAVAATPALRDN